MEGIKAKYPIGKLLDRIGLFPNQPAIAGMQLVLITLLAVTQVFCQEQPEKKAKVPGFVLTDSDGERFSSEVLEGKIVVLDFWATWCAPCLKSLPEMQKAELAYREDPKVVFLYVNTLEPSKRGVQFIKDFLAKKNIDLYFLVDSGNADPTGRSLADIVGISGLPTSIILDDNGYIAFRSSGFRGNSQDILQEITPIIEKIKAR